MTTAYPVEQASCYNCIHNVRLSSNNVLVRCPVGSWEKALEDFAMDARAPNPDTCSLKAT